MVRKRSGHRLTKKRRLDYDYEPVRDRLRYLCEFLFGGSHYEMARELNVCYRHFHSIIRPDAAKGALTIRMAAQIVSRLGVRAEWFLTGAGPVLATTEPDDGLRLPLKIHSAFPLPDTLDFGAGCPPAHLPVVGAFGPTTEPPAAYYQAARALFDANGQQAPVALLLGSEACAESASILPLFCQRYVHFLGMTLAAARLDVYPSLAAGAVDLNHTAVTAANFGMGYGEALATWAFRSEEQRQKSVIATAYGQNVPVTVLAEIGEIQEHINPAIRGAEVGAAVGAAAYVDHLVFTKYFESFCSFGSGVIVCAGEIDRWLAVLRRVFDQKSTPPQITFVLLLPPGRDPPPFVLAAGRIISAEDHPAVFFSHLSSACHDVYANGGLVPQ